MKRTGDLYTKLADEFVRRLKEKQKKIDADKEKLESGKATTEDSWSHADTIGEIAEETAKQFAEEIILPEDVWNDLVEYLRDCPYEEIAEYSRAVQELQIQNSGYGLTVQKVSFNSREASYVAHEANNAASVEKCLMALENINVFTDSIVSDTIEQSSRVQWKAGLNPKIRRIAESGCCEWCDKLEGTYDYATVKHDVYRRHKRCKCLVEYIAPDGNRTDVHSKKTISGKAKEEQLQKMQPVSQVKRLKGKELERQLEKKSTIPEKELRRRIAEGRMSDENQGIIAERILKGEYKIELKYQKYLQHIKGTAQFENATKTRQRDQSFLTISKEETQNLILNYAGKGTIKRDRNGNVLPQEFVTADRVIGFFTENGEEKETTRAMIKYASDGAHVVPVKEK